MSRLIDADRLEPDAEWDPYCDGYTAFSQLQIDAAPTVEDRNTGKWTEDKLASKNHVEKIYRCSACGNFEAWGTTELYNFCPNCGADMRGGKHETDRC